MHPVVALLTVGVEMDVLGLNYTEFRDSDPRGCRPLVSSYGTLQGGHHPGILRWHQAQPETTFGNVKAGVIADKEPTPGAAISATSSADHSGKAKLRRRGRLRLGHIPAKVVHSDLKRGFAGTSFKSAEAKQPLGDLRGLDRVVAQGHVRVLGVDDPDRPGWRRARASMRAGVAVGQDDVLALLDVNAVELPGTGQNADLGFDQQGFRRRGAGGRTGRSFPGAGRRDG